MRRAAAIGVLVDQDRPQVLNRPRQNVSAAASNWAIETPLWSPSSAAAPVAGRGTTSPFRPRSRCRRGMPTTGIAPPTSIRLSILRSCGQHKHARHHPGRFGMLMDCYLEEYDAHPPPMQHARPVNTRAPSGPRPGAIGPRWSGCSRWRACLGLHVLRRVCIVPALAVHCIHIACALHAPRGPLRTGTRSSS